jgi:hypothetical protein
MANRPYLLLTRLCWLSLAVGSLLFGPALLECVAKPLVVSRSIVTNPAMISAVVDSNGTQGTVTFDRSVTEITPGGFSLLVGGIERAVTLTGGSGTDTFAFTFAEVYAGEVVLYSYSAIVGDIRDVNGNDLEGSAVSATNNSTQEPTPDDTTPPEHVSTTISSNGTNVVFEADEPIIVADADGFTFTPSGDPATLAYASGSGTATISFTASRPIDEDETVTIAYDDSIDDVEDLWGNLLATFTAVSVTNNSTYNSGDPRTPIAPTEYTVPAIAANLTSLLSGATRIDVTSSAELTSLTTGGTVDGSVLATAAAAGPVVIVLDHTATFAGRFWFPDLNQANWIYVVPDTFDSLPASGTRCTAADSANCAQVDNIETTSANYQHPAFNIAHGAEKYRFVGIEFEPWAGRGSEIDITLGCFQTGLGGTFNTNPADQYSELPTDIIVDRCYFHGREEATKPDRYAIVLGCSGGAIIDSTIIDFSVGTNAVANAESSVIFCYLGGDQYLIENNAISGAGENVIFGGTDSPLPNPNARDVVIRGNHFFKEVTWHISGAGYDGYNRIIKNLLEFKKVQRALVEGNVFETVGENDGGQQATAIVVTIRNQGGGDLDATVDDVEIRDNIFRDVGVPIRMANTDDIQESDSVKRLWFHNNLAYDIGYLDVSGRYMWYGSGSPLEAAIYVSFTHNTFLKYGGTLNPYWQINHEGSGDGFDNTLFRDNVFEIGRISGTSDLGPLASMNKWHVTWDVSNNVSFDAASASFPPGMGNFDGSTVDRNTSPDANDINFADWAGGDFRLDPACVYAAGNANDATDGTDLGADIDAVETATAGAVSGVWP